MRDIAAPSLAPKFEAPQMLTERTIATHASGTAMGESRGTPLRFGRFAATILVRQQGSLPADVLDYVIDHVQALRHGGSDMPGNMAWQTVSEARAKDRVE